MTQAAMPDPQQTIGLLLAAGASRRFGPQNKLLAMFHGRPLIAHAADAMRAVPLDRRIAVISDPDTAPHLQGFQIVRIPQGEQSDSLRAGLAAAGHPRRLLIALGDMPLITPDLLGQVLSRATDDQPAASLDAPGHPMPPACFPQAALASLAGLTGDQGAGRLIHDLPASQLVNAPGLLADIDTTDALTRLEN